jgi:methyltransferase (TIGR00027 family)
LFTDPVAELFVAAALGVPTEAGTALPRLGPARDDGSSQLWESLYSYFAGRTPFYDNFVVEAAAAGCSQVVVLGAGLDSRAYRLPVAPGTTFFELDTPDVLDFKAAVLVSHELESAATRVPVGIDLREDWASALTAEGFDTGCPTAWLAEGLLMYLTPPEADALLARITTLSAPGSALAGEFLNRRTRVDDVPSSDDGDRAVAEIFAGNDRGGPSVEPETWLAGHGWSGRRRDFLDELAGLGRPVPALFEPRETDPLRLWLFTATLADPRQAG